MNKEILIFVFCISFFLVSCSSADEQILKQHTGNILSENNIIIENEEPLIAACGNTEIDINNINDALETFKVPEDIARSIHVGEYVDDFPVELQELLVYSHDDINDENDNVWQRYKANCNIITSETAGDVPYEDIVTRIKNIYGASVLNMQIVDVDGDGEDEYAVRFMDMKFSGLLFVKKNGRTMVYNWGRRRLHKFY